MRLYDLEVQVLRRTWRRMWKVSAYPLPYGPLVFREGQQRERLDCEVYAEDPLPVLELANLGLSRVLDENLDLFGYIAEARLEERPAGLKTVRLAIECLGGPGLYYCGYDTELETVENDWSI